MHLEQTPYMRQAMSDALPLCTVLCLTWLCIPVCVFICICLCGITVDKWLIIHALLCFTILTGIGRHTGPISVPVYMYIICIRFTPTLYSIHVPTCPYTLFMLYCVFISRLLSLLLLVKLAATTSPACANIWWEIRGKCCRCVGMHAWCHFCRHSVPMGLFT